jgi:GrpB-like predicted nucleotidyltransferase (UPF0157 family)
VRDPDDVSRYDEELGKVTIGGAQSLTQPIEIRDHDPTWPHEYEGEEVRISWAADRVLYADAKRELAARRWKYMQQYADAKTEVIREIMARADATAG